MVPGDDLHVKRSRLSIKGWITNVWELDLAGWWGILTGMHDGKATFDRALGKRIREARDGAGVKQDQLAQAVGLSRTSITNIERGRQGVQAYLLARIADVLAKPPAELLPRLALEPEVVPEKMRSLEPDKRAWAERVLKQTTEDDDNAA